MRPVRSPLLLIALVLALLGSACGSDDESGPTETTATEITTTVPETPADTEPSGATTTEAAPEPVGAATPADAAMALYDAWVNEDRPAAALVADPDAVETMWTAEKGPYELYRHCDDGEFDTSGCLFRDRTTNHTIQINLERRDGAWVVSGTFYSEE